MCGITGIINKNKNSVDKAELKNINDLIAHRGPDDEGVYYEDNFAFGHRRLSILDLSTNGHQPMHYLDKYTITYNGEIYNYKEIREALISDGYTFKSKTDTEVILASYDKWGEKCVNKFNGMWAFALYNREKNIIFCSRDRFGIKPFYYVNTEDKFVFGSEIKQLLDFLPQRKVNKKILMDYLVTHFEEHTNETFFEGVLKLPQSHNLIYNIKKHKFNISQYYTINKISAIKGKDYHNQIIDAIKLRLRSDVKVGACLSGGLDSSTIVSIASKFYKNKDSFTAIHAKSIDKSRDESVYAETVANANNLDLIKILPTSDDFIKNIDEVIYTQEEPFGGPSVFMQYFVMKKAKEVGCKVMLDGQGGDETLLGYTRYYASIFYSKLIKNKNILKSIKFLKSINQNNKSLPFNKLIVYIIATYFYKLRLARHKKNASFIKNNIFNYSNYGHLKEISRSYKDIFKMQELEICKTNLPMLLRYEDKNSMRNSVETRLPFVDYLTLEKALSLSLNDKIRDGWSKFTLRKLAENYIPDIIAWRKDKFGFLAPDKVWLDDCLGDMKKTVLKSKILNVICKKESLKKYETLNMRNRWLLFNIAKWEEIYKVEL